VAVAAVVLRQVHLVQLNQELMVHQGLLAEAQELAAVMEVLVEEHPTTVPVVQGQAQVVTLVMAVMAHTPTVIQAAHRDPVAAVAAAG
jgi:hypothetical protein